MQQDHDTNHQMTLKIQTINVFDISLVEILCRDVVRAVQDESLQSSIILKNSGLKHFKRLLTYLFWLKVVVLAVYCTFFLHSASAFWFNVC